MFCMTKLDDSGPAVKYHVAMSNMIKTDLWGFYLEGRADRTLKNEIDEGVLVDRMVAAPEANLRATAVEAAEGAAAPLAERRVKRAWVTAHKLEDGAYADEAYAAYLRGRIDKLALATEKEMFRILEDEFEPEGDAAPAEESEERTGSRGRR